MKKWQTKKSTKVHENPWFKIIQDDVVLPSGRDGKYFILEKSDYCVTIPIEAGFVYMVRQYRYTIKSDSLEFPMGVMAKGEDPKHAALRELREETGLVAGKIEYVGFYYPANGIARHKAYVFLAGSFRRGKQALEEAEHGLTVEKYRVIDLEKLIACGKILDGPTISAFGIYKAKGK